MRPSSRWAPCLRSTRLWISGVACGVLALGGIGVIFSAPAAAPPFHISPFPLYGGNTYVVNTTQDLTGVGGCLSGVGLCSFRQAVNQYNLDQPVAIFDQDQITFSEPLCVVNQLELCIGDVYSIATYGNVVFDNPYGVSVTITGNGQGVTNINGGGAGGSDLQVDGGYGVGAVTLSKLTISQGYSTACGGGIFNDGGTLTVNDSQIENSLATTNGGGICNLNGTVNLNSSGVLNNSLFEQGDGGGIYNSGGLLQINGSIIASNGDTFEPEDGGGIYNAAVPGTSAWLVGTTVDSNLAMIDGGGIYNGGVAVLYSLGGLAASTVEFNTAGTLGGGVYNACNAIFPDGGAGVTSNTPDNVYQQPCSILPLPGFPLGRLPF